MPHIKPDFRPKYNDILNLLPPIESKGDLEYIIYRTLKLFMKTRDSNFTNLHEAVYGGIHASEEFKRNYLDKREDFAISQNGEA